MADLPKREGRERKTLFGMTDDDLAEALEAIYKRQKAQDEKIDVLLQLATNLHEALKGGGAVAQAAAQSQDDGIPPLVKWAIAQPWGTNLMHTVTDPNLLGPLGKALVELVKTWASKSKTVSGTAKVVENVAGEAAKAAGGS